MRQVLHSFVSLLTGQLTGIVLGVILGRTLGPVGKGVYSFAQYCAAMGMAGGDGVRSAYAYELKERGPEAARSLWGGSLLLTAAIGGFASSICVVLAIRYPSHIEWPFLAIALPSVIYAQAVNLLWGMAGRIETLNVRNTLTLGAGSNVLAAVALLVFHAPLTGVLAIWTLGIVAGAIWSTFGVKSFLGGMPSAPDRAALAAQTVFASKATLSGLTTFLARRIDIFIVAALATPREFGIYSLAVATAELMFQVSNSITWTTVGRVATLEIDEANTLVARIVRSLVGMQSVAAAGLFLFGPWLIVIVYGGRFAESGLPLRLMLPGVICYSADQLLSFYISVRTGRPGLLLGFETISLVVCGIAAGLGVHFYGIAGAAGANTVTYVLSFVIKTSYFARVGHRGMGEILIPRWTDAPERLRSLARRAGRG